MTTAADSQGEFLRAEYTALAGYFGTVVTFRFSTAAFFIAAVALVLNVQPPTPAHYVLLFAISLGIWVVELRNRALFDNLSRRAWEIERAWARFEPEEKLPFFIHMTPSHAAKHGLPIPKDLQKFDQTRILWFPYFSARHLSHTLGLDILYLSVMAYALWSLWSLRSSITMFLEDRTMDPISALFTFGIVFLGYRTISAAPTAPSKWSYFLAILGSCFIVGAAALVVAIIYEAN